MDQLPLDFNLVMVLYDLDELLTLLETDVEKWQWLIDELNKQLKEQIE
ncbi:MAG: hypothetical protein ACJA2M_000303 [Polaribacter sp.]|jgi:hypothetical protein